MGGVEYADEISRPGCLRLVFAPRSAGGARGGGARPGGQMVGQVDGAARQRSIFIRKSRVSSMMHSSGPRQRQSSEFCIMNESGDSKKKKKNKCETF